jgi:hypothetical protein
MAVTAEYCPIGYGTVQPGRNLCIPCIALRQTLFIYEKPTNVYIYIL